MHGIGVRTPRGAVVAAATLGSLSAVHMPKDMMLIIEMWSTILAAGWLLVVVRLIGNVTLGATPKQHIRVAPLQTCSGSDVLLCTPNLRYVDPAGTFSPSIERFASSLIATHSSATTKSPHFWPIIGVASP